WRFSMMVWPAGCRGAHSEPFCLCWFSGSGCGRRPRSWSKHCGRAIGPSAPSHASMSRSTGCAGNWATVVASIRAAATDWTSPRLHLQSHRLRTQLGHGVLINSARGYRRALTPEAIAAWHFAPSARSALTDAPTHDLGSLRDLEAAASQWDGEPFPGVELPET